MTVMDNEDPALPEVSEDEAWYDAEIAPALAALAKLCHERGMSFIAAVEYQPGDRGGTYYLTEDAGLQMLALSIDRKRDDATNYLRRRGYTFPAGLVTPAIAKVLPKPKGLPVTIVRGRDGRVLQAEKGQPFPEDVQQLARWL